MTIRCCLFRNELSQVSFFFHIEFYSYSFFCAIAEYGRETAVDISDMSKDQVLNKVNDLAAVSQA